MFLPLAYGFTFLLAGDVLDIGPLDYLRDPYTEVVVDHHHVAPGYALAVYEKVHLIARKLIQHHQRAL